MVGFFQIFWFGRKMEGVSCWEMLLCLDSYQRAAAHPTFNHKTANPKRNADNSYTGTGRRTKSARWALRPLAVPIAHPKKNSLDQQQVEPQTATAQKHSNLRIVGAYDEFQQTELSTDPPPRQKRRL